MINFAADKTNSGYDSLDQYFGPPSNRANLGSRASRLAQAARYAFPSAPRGMTPWLTVVVGSGCPRAADDALASLIESLPAQVAESLADEPTLPDGRTAAEVARAFCLRLMADRAGRHADVLVAACESATRDAALEHAALPSDRLFGLAHQLVGCALLTEAFREAQSLTGPPLGWGAEGEEIATIDATISASRITAQYLEPARRHLEVSSDLPATIGVDRWTSDHIERSRVLALTEWCWIQILEMENAHHCWQELHAAGVLASGQSLDGVLSPIENQSAYDRILDVSTAAAETAWEVLTGRATEVEVTDGARSSDFIWSLAGLLLAQNQSRRSEDRKARRQPVPAAFATGFDVELEIALLLRSDSPFLIALPVRVVVGGRAVLCWLGCEVDASVGEPEFDQIRVPMRWHLLSNEKRYGFLEPFNSMPVIVHLSGCPIVELPDLRDESQAGLTAKILEYLDVSLRVDDDPPVLGHALTMDEYLAFQQSTTESFLYPSTTGESKHVRTAGLPASITDTDSPESRRFWLLCGLHLGDLATRLRVATRSPRHPLSGGRPLGESREVAHGLAVGRRLAEPERDLLHWSGFDTVDTDCKNLSELLDEYASELR